jgi:hypothetical protein
MFMLHNLVPVLHDDYALPVRIQEANRGEQWEMIVNAVCAEGFASHT